MDSKNQRGTEEVFQAGMIHSNILTIIGNIHTNIHTINGMENEQMSVKCAEFYQI